MGNLESLFSRSTEHTIPFEELPPPRIVNSMGTPVRVEERDTATRSPAPDRNTPTQKHSIGFSVLRESVKLDRHSEQRCILSFEYTSSIELTVSVKGYKHGQQQNWSSSFRLPASKIPTTRKHTVDVPPQAGELGSRLVTEVQGGHSIMTIFSIYERGSLHVQSVKIKVPGDDNWFKLYSMYRSGAIAQQMESPMCCICLSSIASIGYLPCRHICVCNVCARGALLSTNNRCPVCMSSVHGRLVLD